MSHVSTTLDLPLLELQSDSGEMFAVENPATGETIAEVPRMGEAETRRALEARRGRAARVALACSRRTARGSCAGGPT